MIKVTYKFNNKVPQVILNIQKDNQIQLIHLINYKVVHQ
jgi:hypothetical protein